MENMKRNWEIISKTRTHRWTAEENDPAKKNVWRTIRSVGSALMFCFPESMSGIVYLYRMRDLSTNARKNVYSRYPFEIGAIIEECDWEGEVDECVFHGG
jgi:hypothetical protein